ncbi:MULTISPECIES: 3'-5' exonuclease [Prochlorococcus]|uniref:3'-5' exonuclease n=1 Tax=Prochlorococcus TaxID=1218 RepID=UPI00053378DB|nr:MULTISPECIES: 3'-5' exonuclease [Prochlorococcus]KGG12612.1 putative DNA polymerasee III [Prochlorococcus sp. MIT 0601]
MQKNLSFDFDSDELQKGASLEKILILDTETSGLDPKKDKCIEVGAILFDVGTKSVLAQISFLMPVDVNAAERINKISPEITNLSQPWELGIQYFEALVEASDAIVAHNAAFDSQWFGLGRLREIKKPWICSMEDISWPSHLQIRSRPSVRDLALAYEIPVWSAHRALTDCIYLAEVFRRCDELGELLVRGLEPRALMRAEVSYDERHLAKNAGFRWNEPIQGAWTRRLTNSEALELDFPVVLVE